MLLDGISQSSDKCHRTDFLSRNDLSLLSFKSLNNLLLGFNFELQTTNFGIQHLILLSQIANFAPTRMIYIELKQEALT